MWDLGAAILLPLCLHFSSQRWVVLGSLHVLGLAASCPTLTIVDVAVPVGVAVAATETHCCVGSFDEVVVDVGGAYDAANS